MRKAQVRQSQRKPPHGEGLFREPQQTRVLVHQQRQRWLRVCEPLSHLASERKQRQVCARFLVQQQVLESAHKPRLDLLPQFVWQQALASVRQSLMGLDDSTSVAKQRQLLPPVVR
jgi:hypothetical protein